MCYQFNNKWEAGLEIGIKKGEVCKLSPVGESTTFKVAPYVRYTAVETKLVNLFVEGTIGYSSFSKGGGDLYEVGIKPVWLLSFRPRKLHHKGRFPRLQRLFS
ncbi:MAG: hypothetical protein ACLRYB_15620 [Segatella copri]